MAKDAEAAVKAKVSSVESEQGSFAEAGGDPPPNFGHDSAKSGGVAGNLIPGGSGGDDSED